MAVGAAQRGLHVAEDARPRNVIGRAGWERRTGPHRMVDGVHDVGCQRVATVALIHNWLRSADGGNCALVGIMTAGTAVVVELIPRIDKLTGVRPGNGDGKIRRMLRVLEHRSGELRVWAVEELLAFAITEIRL